MLINLFCQIKGNDNKNKNPLPEMQPGERIEQGAAALRALRRDDAFFAELLAFVLFRQARCMLDLEDISDGTFPRNKTEELKTYGEEALKTLRETEPDFRGMIKLWYGNFAYLQLLSANSDIIAMLSIWYDKKEASGNITFCYGIPVPEDFRKRKRYTVGGRYVLGTYPLTERLDDLPFLPDVEAIARASQSPVRREA